MTTRRDVIGGAAATLMLATVGNSRAAAAKRIDKFGAPISDDEARQIADYLAKHYSN